MTVTTLDVGDSDTLSEGADGASSDSVVVIVTYSVVIPDVCDVMVLVLPSTVENAVTIAGLAVEGLRGELRVEFMNGGSLAAGTVVVIVVIALRDGASVGLATSAVAGSHTANESESSGSAADVGSAFVLGVGSISVCGSFEEAAGCDVVTISGGFSIVDVATSFQVVKVVVDSAGTVGTSLSIFIEAAWTFAAFSSASRVPVAVNHSAENVASAGLGRELVIVVRIFCGATPCSVVQLVVVLVIVEVVRMVDRAVSKSASGPKEEVVLVSYMFPSDRESSLMNGRRACPYRISTMDICLG